MARLAPSDTGGLPPSAHALSTNTLALSYWPIPDNLPAPTKINKTKNPTQPNDHHKEKEGAPNQSRPRKGPRLAPEVQSQGPVVLPP